LLDEEREQTEEVAVVIDQQDTRAVTDVPA
jgi:hypothetical protein